jgi:hypothetical protein
MQMNESEYKGKFCKLLKEEAKGSVVFRHEDQFTAGIPDISFNWMFHTTWIEAKIGSNWKQTGLKIEIAKRLYKQSSCFYIILYKEENYIVRPKDIEEWKTEYVARLPFIIDVVQFFVDLHRKIHDGRKR